MVRHLRGLGNHRGPSRPSPRIAGVPVAGDARTRSQSQQHPTARRQYLRHPTDVPIACGIGEVVGDDGRDYLRNIGHGARCFVSPRSRQGPHSY